MENGQRLSRLKLSVAMAIIRKKPANMTGESYAKQLADQYQTSQQHWKRRCREAESEILHLRQQLMMQTAAKCSESPKQSQSGNQTDKDDGVAMPCSQPLFLSPPPSGSSNERPSQTTGSQVEPGSSTQPEASQRAASTNTQTSTSSGSVSLAKHAEFLQHVLNIQASSRMLETDGNICISSCQPNAEGKLNFEDVVTDSLLHSVFMIQKHLGDKEFSLEVQKDCVQSIVKLMEKLSPGQFREVLLENIVDLCQHIINQIMDAEESSSQQDEVHQHNLELLSVFSKCNDVAPILAICLAERILQCSWDLRQIVGENLPLDSVKLNNVYNVIAACENCLLSGSMEDIEQEVKDRVRNRLQSLLEGCLLDMTGLFPLFEHGVLTLLSYLQ